LAQVFRNVISNAFKFGSAGMQISVKAVWSPQQLLKQGEEESFMIRCHFSIQSFPYCFTGSAMIGNIDSSQRIQFAARGSVIVTVEDNGPGEHASIHSKYGH
jgi:signal transduction histidine kinase